MGQHMPRKRRSIEEIRSIISTNAVQDAKEYNTQTVARSMATRLLNKFKAKGIVVNYIEVMEVYNHPNPSKFVLGIVWSNNLFDMTYLKSWNGI